MDALMTTPVSGIVLGSLYALMASGLSLIWTTLDVFNFAHGALMMIGAFVAWTVAEGMGHGLWAGPDLGPCDLGHFIMPASRTTSGVVHGAKVLNPSYATA